MADRPIIFSGPMVRALLAGTKTQTRRLITPGTCTVLGNRVNAKNPAWAGLKFDRAEVRSTSPTGVARPHLAVPWVHPGDEAQGMAADAVYLVDSIIEAGDRLYVREAHYLTNDNDEEYAVCACDDDAVREHLAEIDALPASVPEKVKAAHRKLRPSIHMPRWASRLTLTVTEVRVERLNDISEADARAEGVTIRMETGLLPLRPHEAFPVEDCRVAFQRLWCDLHGPEAWAANPWVAAVTFGVVHANIDAAAGGRA